MSRRHNSDYEPTCRRKRHFRGFLRLIIIAGLIIYFINSSEDMKERFFNAASHIPLIGDYFSEALMDECDEWDELVLSDKLPDTHYKIEYIWRNSRSNLKIDLEMTVKEFYDYIETCREFGYDIDIDESDWEYSALNVEGYKISLDYREYAGKLSVEVFIPNENDDSALELTEANVNADETDEIWLEDGAGSDETQKTDEGSVDDAVPISPENSNAASNDTGAASAEQGEVLVDGMRPSVKNAIDSFEEYFVEYVELIEKIEADSDNPWLLVDYAEFLATYASTMEDFENMEDEDLNDAEMAYYLAALGRVNQMLINVTYEVDY